MTRTADERTCPLCAQGEAEMFAQVEARSYFRCRRCALTFLAPSQRPSPAEERTEYELHENDPHDPRYRAFLDRLAAPLAMRLPPGACGLDFGCGPGPTLSEMLRERGFPMRDYDPLFRPDEEALASTYDFITCTEVAEHLHHPGAVFIQLNAMLRPGGQLGVMTSFLVDDERFAEWHYRRERSHVVFFKRATMEWLARWFGWSLSVFGRNVAIFRKPALENCGAVAPS